MARICITRAEKLNKFWLKRNVYRKICPTLLLINFFFFFYRNLPTTILGSFSLSTMGARWKKLAGKISIFILLKNMPAHQISNWVSPLPATYFSFLPGLLLLGGGNPWLALLDKHHLIVNKVQRGSNRTHFQEWRGCLLRVNICFWTSQYILLSFIWLVNS